MSMMQTFLINLDKGLVFSAYFEHGHSLSLAAHDTRAVGQMSALRSEGQRCLCVHFDMACKRAS